MRKFTCVALCLILFELITKDLDRWNELKWNPASNYMFKVNDRNTRTRCEMCLKLTIKTPE